MHKKPYSYKPVLLLVAALTFLYLAASYRSGFGRCESIQFSGLTMGTSYRVEVVGRQLEPEQIREAKAKVDGVLKDYNSIMSTYILESDISRFNASYSTEPVEVSESLVHVTRAALELAEASEGAFDPTVGPLVDLWGFGGGEDAEGTPTADQIQEVLANVGYKKLSVSGNSSLRKSIPDLQLDLSAIAKGSGVDMIMFLMNKLGYTNVLVEIGGEIAVAGHNRRGKDWKLSVEIPRFNAGIDEGRYTILAMGKGAVATSGDYRNFRKEDGRHYSHVIDPRTGWPVSNGVASVTVVAEDCMTADALATALMVMGPEKGMDLMNDQDGADAMIIVRNDTGEYLDHRTSGFDRYVFQN